MKDPAPLYTQTFDMVKWVLENLPGTGALGESIHQDAIRLLDHTVLALKGFEVMRQLDRADATNAVLRVRLRLAHDRNRIPSQNRNDNLGFRVVCVPAPEHSTEPECR